MGLRLRKSIKLAPGIRMNLSGSGPSLTLGPRGFSLGVGKRGTYLNTGIPGSGIFSRERLDSTSSTPASNHKPEVGMVSVNISVEEDGTIIFLDQNGNPASEKLIEAVKKQKPDAIRHTIQKTCDEINERVESLGGVHLDTLDSKIKPKFIKRSFDQPKPLEPKLKKAGFFQKLLKFNLNKIENANEVLTNNYLVAVQQWDQDGLKYSRKEALRKNFIEQDIYSNVNSMEKFLEENLHDIVWPKETNVSFDILDAGKTVFLDVDLPEIENLPNKTATAPTRGFKLMVKEMSATQSQKLYMRHVHGIGFRIIGETFAALPVANTVVLSAYSLRSNPSNGIVDNEYLFSVKVTREKWEEINFSNLINLDVIEALSRFDLRRNMSKTGIFKAIEPFEVP